MNKPRFLDRLFGQVGTATEASEVITVHLDGESVDVVMRHHAKARRLSLRVDPAAGGAVLTLPPRTSRRQAEAFASQNAAWLVDAVSNLPKHLPFAEGSKLAVLGRPVTVRHCPERRSGVEWGDGEILVSGRVEHLPRRLRDFLKKEARAAIDPMARDMAESLGVSMGRVTVRDTRTRWGSCSAKGDLSFSWRLIFAPPEVLRYVVAHEVAHLRHMDHSKAFWETVTRLHPNQKQDRKWLNDNGTALHRIG